jgi:hypothetical protein
MGTWTIGHCAPVLQQKMSVNDHHDAAIADNVNTDRSLSPAVSSPGPPVQKRDVKGSPCVAIIVPADQLVCTIVPWLACTKMVVQCHHVAAMYDKLTYREITCPQESPRGCPVWKRIFHCVTMLLQCTTSWRAGRSPVLNYHHVIVLYEKGLYMVTMLLQYSTS